MCGLAGILTGAGSRHEELRADVGRMTAPLAHRGPDDDGTWVDPAAGIAFGFRRLAIIDLSESGHQPMHSSSNRFTIVFNGEVYNHPELRRELQRAGAQFRGRSDTEVILAAFEHWGVEAAVRRFIGMFAIAAWDAATRRLFLIRDRLGIKPLFVSARPGIVTFGSELKALAAGPFFDRTIDRSALTDYLRYLYVPAPRTIYRGAFKLLPGHILTITDPSLPIPPSTPYWTVEDAARRGRATPFTGSDHEAISDLEDRLSEAVRLRMEADVPLGALLSGGIDSSVVVGLMQRAASRPVKTYSIAFEVADFNEAPQAARVAAHLGTDHTELMVTGQDALDVVPRLADIFDEPHADAGQIPEYLVCALARRDVTVALSGDGGDEIFGGYNRYTYGERLIGRVTRVPRPARTVAAAGIAGLSPASWSNVARVLAPVLPPLRHHALAAQKLDRFGRVLAAESPPLMYRSLLSAWPHPERLVVGGHSAAGTCERVLAAAQPSRLIERMMLADQSTYLPDDQLAKVDRVSMAVSLEVRVPLLDHRIVEFAWTLPAELKIRRGQGKWPLRELAYRLVPKALLDRPKQGFSVPLDSWLRGPLRAWAEDLLSPTALERDGLLRSAPVREAWHALIGGRNESAQALWSVLLFQQWRLRWLS